MNKWDRRFLALADHIASWSKDPSTKVGCVLVAPDRRVISLGYNGFPRGVQDLDSRLNDRPVKYQMVQHAEANAVTQAVGSVSGSTAYISARPCANCTGLLIQAGVSKVVTRRPPPDLAERFLESFAASDQMARDVGLTIEFVDQETAES